MMTKWMAKGYLWLLLVLLYSPILIIMIFSFTEAKVLGNWTGFSTKLYSSLFTGGVQRSLVSALWNTFAIAMIARPSLRCWVVLRLSVFSTCDHGPAR